MKYSLSTFLTHLYLNKAGYVGYLWYPTLLLSDRAVNANGLQRLHCIVPLGYLVFSFVLKSILV